MTNPIYLAIKAQDNDFDSIYTNLAITEITKEDLELFTTHRDLIQNSQALKICIQRRHFLYINSFELNQKQEEYCEEIEDQITAGTNGFYIPITKDVFDTLKGYPLLRSETDLVDIYQDNSFRGMSYSDTGVTVFSECIKLSDLTLTKKYNHYA